MSYAKNGPSLYNSEWRLLDEKMSSLTSYLTDELKRKIRIRELGTYFGKWPLVFLVASIFTSIFEIILYQYQRLEPQQIDGSSPLYHLSYFLILMFWCISQGGLGACAFLGTSAIVKVPVDGGLLGVNKTRELVDVTDRNVLNIRILLGALFGFLLCGSFAQKAFTVGNEIFFNHAQPTIPDIAIILIPFVCGFSTSLVLVVLNRLVVAIETFFGLPGRT